MDPNERGGAGAPTFTQGIVLVRGCHQLAPGTAVRTILDRRRRLVLEHFENLFRVDHLA